MALSMVDLVCALQSVFVAGLCMCLSARASLRHVCTRARLCACACLGSYGTCMSLCALKAHDIPRGVVSPSTRTCVSVRVPVCLCVYLVLVPGLGDPAVVTPPFLLTVLRCPAPPLADPLLGETKLPSSLQRASTLSAEQCL